MFRIAYQIPTGSGSIRISVVVVSDRKEASEICDLCDKLGHKIVDVTNVSDSVLEDYEEA